MTLSVSLGNRMTTTNEDANNLQNKDSRIRFQLRQRSAHRSTNELVDQVMDQLKAERAQAAFKLAVKQKELNCVI